MRTANFGVFFLSVFLSSTIARCQSGTLTLTSGQGAFFFTNATSSSGGDLTYIGNSFAFEPGTDGGYQVSAADLMLLVGSQYSGQSAFDQLTQAQLSEIASRYDMIVGTGYIGRTQSARVGDILIVVIDAGAAFVKVLVTAISATSATLEYQCYGSLPYVPPPGAPTIKQILNNYNYSPAANIVYGIAPSSLFIVQGTNLANPGSTAVLQSTAPPGLPLTVNGASISIDVSGTAVGVPIYYASPTQIAAVLPASTPRGSYIEATVSAPGGTAGWQIPVGDAAPGLASYYGTGTGPSISTDPVTGSLFTPENSAKPGQTIVLWGTGLGPDPSVSDTTFTTPTKSVSTPLQIFIGGVESSVSYHGSSGYPGVNQINVTIPASVSTGCSVSVEAMSGSAVSNTLTIPIAPGGGSCSDLAFGVNGSRLASLSSQSSVLVGQFSVSPTGVSGVFQTMTGANYALTGGIGSLGSCTVTPNPVVSATAQGVDVGTVALVDAAGTFPFSRDSTGVYIPPVNLSIPVGSAFSLQGSGNASVGGFSTTLTLPQASVIWTNSRSNISLSGDLTVTWSGSAPGTVMQISGLVNDATLTAEFTCYAPADASQFTVPQNILRGLQEFNGVLTLQNLAYVPFSTSGLGAGATIVSISQARAAVFFNP